MSKQMHHVMLPGEGEWREVVDQQVRSELPQKALVLENKTLSVGDTYAEAVASTNRLLSQMEFDVRAGDVFSVPAGYTMRIVCFRNNTVQAFIAWAGSHTITAGNVNNYTTLRLQIAKKSASSYDPSSAAISPDEVQPTIPADVWKGLDQITTAENVREIVEEIIPEVADALEERLEAVENALPSSYLLENLRSSISEGVEITSDDMTRLLTPVVSAALGDTFAVADGWQMRDSRRGNADGTNAQGWKAWKQSWTCAASGYYRIQLRRTDNAAITSEDATLVITTTLPLEKPYTGVASRAEIDDLNNRFAEATNQFNLNIYSDGCENVMQSYPLSYWPQAVSFSKQRDKLYYGFCTGDGYTGVGEYDFDSREFHKCYLKKNEVDDHNMAAVWVTANGTIIAVYTDGHNTGHNLYVRRSSVPESVESFDDAVVIDCGADTTYAQILQHDGALYLFFRRDNKEWFYTKSADEGLTWSNVKGVIRKPDDGDQYYCKFQYTTTPGVFRICMYANPKLEKYGDVLMGFVDFTGDEMEIRDADNETVMTQVDDEFGGAKYAEDENTYNFTKIIDKINEDYDAENDFGNDYSRIRLNDVKVTATGTWQVLITRWPGWSGAPDEGAYYIVEDGTETKVCDTKKFVWGNMYPNGISFAAGDSDDLYVIRAQLTPSHADVAEIYTYSDGAVTLKKTLATQAHEGTSPTWKPQKRLFRPIPDLNGSALMWTRGWYNNSYYDDFNMDLQLYRLDGEDATNAAVMTTLDSRVDTLEDPDVTVSGTAPEITAQAGRRYLCGTLTSLSFTPCASGLCEVVFTSGSTPTVLTLPNTVKMPDWWTGTAANRTYDIMILNGVYGVVTSWAT